MERQRSVTSSANHGSESNSLEGLNLERGDSNYKTRCVEQLDNQVSSLHQDVAALSVEVSIVTAIGLLKVNDRKKNQMKSEH